MQCAVVIANGIKQVMFTPETSEESQALEHLRESEKIELEYHQGTFYNDPEGMYAGGYNVAFCSGGYLRAYKRSDSLIIVVKPKEVK